MKQIINLWRWLRRRLFGGAYLPLPTRTNIADPMAFLAPQGITLSSTLVDRRHDWPLPIGYEICDCVRLDHRSVLQTFVMQPFDVWDYADGDGGQVAEVCADGYVRFTKTRDGGKPYTQFFTGETGWIVFGVDAEQDRWRTVVARLTIGRSPTDVPTQGLALTRYLRAHIQFPFAVNGAREDRTLMCVVSEHYDGETIETSRAVERSYFAAGYGLVRWEAWDRTPPKISDLGERYFPVAYSEPPGPGWQLEDIRTFTNIVTEPAPVPVPPLF